MKAHFVEVQIPASDIGAELDKARVLVAQLQGLSALPAQHEGGSCTLCAFILVGPEMSWPIDIDCASFVRLVELLDANKPMPPLVLARPRCEASWSLFRVLTPGEDVPRACDEAEAHVARAASTN